MKRMTIAQEIQRLEKAVGGLSKPSKMPCESYSIPAERCITGSKLREIPGSVCASCYARKGFYQFPAAQRCMKKRFAAMRNLVKWSNNMSTLLALKNAKRPPEKRYFRWHDSGDLQSLGHLSAIVHVAISNPDIRFWLPTKEPGIVKEYVEHFDIPRNLTIRVAATRIGEVRKGMMLYSEVVASSVGSGQGFHCPARTQGNKCGTCRACWDREVLNVDYEKH